MATLDDLRRGKCPYCAAGFHKLGWRPHLSEHLYQIHRRKVVGEVLNWTEDSFAAIELRSTQRSLLLSALDTNQFTVENGGDSTSLWSMARRGWFTCSIGDSVQACVWRLTELGQAVARAALWRVRTLQERARHPIKSFSGATARGGDVWS